MNKKETTKATTAAGARILNAEIEVLLDKQKSLTKTFTVIAQKLFETQSKINDLLLKKTNFKITKTLLQNDILTEKEVLNLLGISKSTLQRRRKAGLIPYSKQGKSIIYSRKAIQAKLKENETVNKTSIFD